MRELTIETVTARSRIIVATTGTITLVLKLNSKCLRSFSIASLRRQPCYPQNEIDFHIPFFGHDDFLRLAGEPLMPGLELVSSGRDVLDHVPPFVVGHREEGILQHHHYAAHPAVDRTKNID